MATYSDLFAAVYNARWGRFAEGVAARLAALYEGSALSRSNRRVLDLGCGTGQLAVFFLRRGYEVFGIDQSEAMLGWARRNAAEYVDAGRACFARGDIARFECDRRFGLIVSTFDTMNHLASLVDVESCGRSALRCAEAGALFVFDMNTRLGLARWNNVEVDDAPEWLLVNRGIFTAGGERAVTRISGCARQPEGSYARFEETIHNTAFEVGDVVAAMRGAGWPTIHVAAVGELTRPLADPEQEPRVYFVAQADFAR